MLVSTLRDKVLRMTNATEADVLGDKNAVVRDFISTVQQGWAEHTERFTKVGWCWTRATGGERAQSEYNLVRRPESTSGGLPYKYISVVGVMFDEEPLVPIDYKRWMVEKRNHSGDPYYFDPRSYWIFNNILHLWPIPDSVKKLRVLYVAIPNDIELDSENIAVPVVSTLLDGVAARLYNQLKDSDRRNYYQSLFDRAVSTRRSKRPIESDVWAPMAGISNEVAGGTTETTEEFL